MCNYCFDSEILSFKTDEHYLAVKKEVDKKKEKKTLLFLKEVIEENGTPLFKIFGLKFFTRIGDTYDLYQCLKCDQYWKLSEPENSWRGYLKKVEQC